MSKRNVQDQGFMRDVFNINQGTYTLDRGMVSRQPQAVVRRTMTGQVRVTPLPPTAKNKMSASEKADLLRRAL
jgi:hypothetical protein